MVFFRQLDLLYMLYRIWFFRFAGDEFTIVMYDANHQEVTKVYQDILTDIQLYDAEVSIGNATSQINKSMPAMVIKNTLFELADKALL